MHQNILTIITTAGKLIVVRHFYILPVSSERRIPKVHFITKEDFMYE